MLKASLFYFILCNIHDITNEDGSHVEVRAVFIDCELDERKDVSCDSDNSRFQREELFKHNILRECKKKLALTVKMISEPGKSSGDEYIPIEHVFDGSKKKRVRLLDPFVLRLRREEPLQAYKIRRIDTVSGILTNSDDHAFQEINKNSRMRRTSKTLTSNTDDYNIVPLQMLERRKRGLETYFIQDNNAGRDMSNASSYFDGNIIKIILFL
ncbi:unnamed protein product [Parnassius mnemosyne]|uniref:Uncharacterized protein n=1 Tax=Parnassius mnemosyne TaxID=213953 RepID=A0AAV1LWX2_9NEOP